MQLDFASTAEQEMEGFTRIGVDATGSKIAPIDEFVTSLKHVTPTSRDTVKCFNMQQLGLDVLMWSASDYESCYCACQCPSREHTYASPRSEEKS